MGARGAELPRCVQGAGQSCSFRVLVPVMIQTPGAAFESSLLCLSPPRVFGCCWSFLGVTAVFLTQATPWPLSPQFRVFPFQLPGFAGGRARVMCERPSVPAGLLGRRGGGTAGPRAGYFRRSHRELRFPARPRRTLRNSGARPGSGWPLRAAVRGTPGDVGRGHRGDRAGTGPGRRPCAPGPLR